MLRRVMSAFVSGAIVAAAIACGSRTPQRTFTVEGQIIAVTPERTEATIKHGAIKGLMPAMTMPYKVKEKSELEAVKPGDIVNATLVILENDAYLTGVKRIGEAPIEQAPPETLAAASAAAGARLLKPGEAVPDGAFVDQDGRKKTFRAFRGSTVILTFIYTKCPIPTFCPMMDRHFATLQEDFHDDPALKNVHLVTVSFDPDTDTPAVLKKHARELKADLTRWTFLTGKREDIDQYAARFGLSVARAPNDARDITHNLRTAVIGPDGTLKKIYTGNEWTPKDILEDLKPTANASIWSSGHLVVSSSLVNLNNVTIDQP
jgi:protein SCO1/2